ncbi:amidohydrolase family protein [Parvularcula sp. IMCC14364]|uniref:N-acyl-D-amino-acid deacylase family protein n=1 Tax=Parvularcula sp. IMCC14364 TaxID=3067902 RepID=UPI002741BC7A|nr:amidohydrolase family protein [Parvularcula sp. IMCC14364]
MQDTDWDYLIKGGLVFDGKGGHATREDIAVADGVIVARGANLDTDKAAKIVDAHDQWVIPGMVDVHTHYDLEIEVSPGLPESVRHGTTTVVMSNCSLGLAYGAQRKDGDDPVVSCFARVENMPKHVLKKVADMLTWEKSDAYIDHLHTLNLGPNVVPMIPHSMLRIEVMGLKESVSREPTDAELGEMKALLQKGMEEGYAGFSTDALPFHFLANDPNRDKQIPTQFASYKELKALTSVVREYDRVWQATPPKDSPPNTIKTFLLTSGRLHGKPLKTTVVAALDVHTNRNIVRLGKLLATILNSSFLDGRFHLQALAAPFKIWADGMYSPLSEEIDELRELIETDLEDREGRQKLLNDPGFITRFRKMWLSGKSGFGPARLKRLLRLEDYAFSRALDEMIIEKCPVTSWEGKSFEDIFRQVPGLKGADSAEQALIDQYFSDVRDEADFVLATLRAFDTDLIWYTVTANRDPEKTRALLMDPKLLPGFNDSGAHLTNMAFYDCNLRALQLAQQGGAADVGYMVKRLTRDVAEIFGLPVGTIKVGAPADIAVINPVALKAYDAEANVQRVYRDEFEHEQLVNRSDGVVTLTMIGGKTAWRENAFAAALHREKFGRPLLVNQAAPAAMAAE